MTTTLPFFLSKPKSIHLPVHLVSEKNFDSWVKKQAAALKNAITQSGFGPKGKQTLILQDKNGTVEKIYTAVSTPVDIYDLSKTVTDIKKYFSSDFLKNASFELQAAGTLTESEMERAHIGWGLTCYVFDRYKNSSATFPALVIAKDSDKKRIEAFVQAVHMIRDLVNTPANDFGPEELEKAAQDFSKKHKTTFSVIRDKELLKQNFPMIYNVGKASPRRPRLIDLRWGNEKHPKVTLVGKGVCFDTGGLDIKPSEFMITMKKDMGGAAHVLALAHLVITQKLPINLRVLIPTVENSISGEAYRASDVLPTRKGLTVEIGNTDAEGRLILSDALTLACEEKPELIIDFATLTGAARVALGYDLPALFTNNDDLGDEIKKLSATPDVCDPVWPLPLWKPYRKDMDSNIADISSTGKGKAGATTAALYLNEFIEGNIDWVHMDVFSWSQTAKPGRPQGGADTGMRAIFGYLEKRYGKTKKKA
ncbi:MAG: leucyl aminopeptidase family protein [Alphaproteobacteria bacterium]|nr:leucyl aminopeptidase family protein [Alphaproteobacteria bacterium]